MSQSSPSKKSLPALIGGAVLVLVAGYFGIDLGSSSDSADQKAAPSSAAAGASTAAGASSPAGGDEGDVANQGESDLPTCAMDSLPQEAHQTAEDILAGGPYDYPDNDNVRFGNYEGVLPQQAKDYYREYTVETPGIGHRGAKRIVTGGDSETDPDVWYYTDDHYESFCSIPDAED
ncbi:ribonuclease domain-containing protein [Corynebacterium sp. HMSC069E04]|uniref:ribonuclease domain-containing protein n=1 Tax=Corynebacterium sp. HMSC069E04 TaxID=1739400 RepID=UPI0008A657C5|nr:ribonuclease domain-containing protein [Corynebacterium sp. HMSC069E04]OFS40639.1 ribonuclease [Corynebacterium sp. HMSC069E04]